MRPLIHVDQMLRAAADLPAVACFDAPNGQTMLTWGAAARISDEPWVSGVRHALKHGDDGAFAGGVVGWLSYEAGAQVEKMPPPRGPLPVPDSCMWRVEGAIHLDPKTLRWSVHGSAHFQEEAQALIARARTLPSTETSASSPDPWAPSQNEPLAQAYTHNVGHILDSIRRGEVYQVNLAWEHCDVPLDDATGAWLAIRRANPAHYGAYLRFKDTEIVSNSPELFLELDRSTGRIQSRPIKGTAPMAPGAKEALESSPKERAELTMIVDLVRNDLGRVAQTGTVQAQGRTIRKCGDLWHAEQTVTAQLRPDADALDALAAAFPPGSVTGAPKVKAMEVIHRLERGPRGVYTGAIGWLGDNGDARFSVAIRTATVQEGRARFHVGAGIVADSNPQREWEETLAKAQALATSLGA